MEKQRIEKNTFKSVKEFIQYHEDNCPELADDLKHLAKEANITYFEYMKEFLPIYNYSVEICFLVNEAPPEYYIFDDEQEHRNYDIHTDVV